MAEQNPNIQGGEAQEPIPYVTAEMAWEMSKRAAAEARAEAIKEVQNSTGTQSNIGTQGNENTRDNRNVQNDRDDYDDDRRSRKRRRDNEDEEEDLVGFSPKLVKQLQTTVSVFNTLKDFASNPMQKAIEDRIGGLAAGIIENAFSSPRGPPPKRDLVDTILNSQMAFGLGQGLGSRAPELVESLSKSFGKERAADMVEGMIGKYSAGGGQRKIETGSGDGIDRDKPGSRGSESQRSSGPQKSEDQSNIELLLSLDPNNAEHVSAYAESQGGISIDVARKMLMIHQDDIIKRMKSQGADTSTIETQRGSRVGQDIPSQQTTAIQDTVPTPGQQHGSSIHRVDISPTYQNPPVQQQSPIQQAPPVQYQHVPTAPQGDMQNNMQYMEPEIGVMSPNIERSGQEYAEYDDIQKQEVSQENIQGNNKDVDLSNNQQEAMMKSFAEDIGKVMGDMINKIESLNNTVFKMQDELNNVKKQATQSISEQRVPVQTLEQEHIQESGQQPKFDKDFFPDDLGIEPGKGIKSVQNPPGTNMQDTVRFFPREKVQDKHDFERELEEETRRSRQLINKENNIELLKVEDNKEIKIVESPNIEDNKEIKIVESPKVEDNKEIKIVKKSIMSMTKKKKVGYSLKQKVDNVQPENKNDENNEDNKNDENNEDNKNDENNEDKAE